MSVAPMMEHTDRHLRSFLRTLTRGALLYSEMVHMNALLHGDVERFLGHSPQERPLSLQLGGDDPGRLAQCARLAEDWGYDEVNLNVGCPSERVQRGNFGACLMAAPQDVADMVAAMRAATSVPITVKHRIGIDEIDTYEHMLRFVDVVSEAGADRFTVHARKAWLRGLSPVENRTIPPLRYEEVWRLKAERPHLHVEINGGIRDADAVLHHLEHVDAVMIGRASYEDPWVMAEVERKVYGSEPPGGSRRGAVEAFLPYVARQVDRGVSLHHITRHLVQIFAGQPGTRAWRRHLGTHPRAATGAEAEAILREGLALAP